MYMYALFYEKYAHKRQRVVQLGCVPNRQCTSTIKLQEVFDGGTLTIIAHTMCALVQKSNKFIYIHN